MTTSVVINTVAVQYASGTTECHCKVSAETVLGPMEVSRVVILSSTTLADDWTDAELCAAVAEALGVEPSEVSTAQMLL